MNIAIDTNNFLDFRIAETVIADKEQMVKTSGFFEITEQIQEIHDQIVGEHNYFTAAIFRSLPAGLKIFGNQFKSEEFENFYTATLKPEIVKEVQKTSTTIPLGTYTADVGEVLYLFCGKLKLEIGKIQNQPAKAVEYINEHIGSRIYYVSFYNAIRDPKRGTYSSIRKIYLSDAEKAKRGRAAVNELYKLNGFSKIFTIHFEENSFCVTQRNFNSPQNSSK